MHYEGAIFRPPSEAKSILLQVTTGCSHNTCHFCGAYNDKKFRIKNDDVIHDDLSYASKHFSDNHRLFLCDGDALSIPQKRLISLFDAIHSHLPHLKRISSYANAGNLISKTVDDLRALKERGLTTVHMGLESGDEETLLNVNKGSTSEEIIGQGIKLKDAGITVFITVILGLAGPERSHRHAEKTGKALTRMNPPLVGALSLMPVEGTVLYKQIQAGNFRLMNSRQILQELRTMLAHTELDPGTFYANHASNYLPLKVRMPQDKARALTLIDSALRGEVPLTPEWLRGL